MNTTTATAYHQSIQKAKTIFLKKAQDYGTAWRVLRDIAIVDQLYIKIKRICTLQEVEKAKVNESVVEEWIAIINYAIIGLIQREKKNQEVEELPLDVVEKAYDQQVLRAFELMENKNHDYGEAWRDMHAKSLADICRMKVLRMRQIIANNECLAASEGLDANYLDLMNYAVFYLILFDR